MKIIQISGPLRISTGGPRYTIQRLCNLLGNRHDVRIRFIGSALDDPIEWESGNIEYCQIPASKNPLTLLPYKNLPDDILDGVEIIHSHGLWHRANYVAGVLAKDKVHVITPRGMLTRWSFNYNRWKKRLAWWTFEKKIVQRASCLHATSLDEAKDLRDMGLRNPIAVIPNGIDVPEGKPVPSREILEERWPVLRDKKIMLFMSRIHKKKGLDMLAEIWGELASKYKDWHLVIAGTDKDNHWHEVEKILLNNGAINSTLYVGLQHGREKEALLASCEFAVLPTFSENFGVVIGEVLAYGRPVVTTTGAPWKEINEHECGWWIEPDKDCVRDALTAALETDCEELCQMGLRGRILVKEKYGWDSIAEEIHSVYKWLLEGREKPGCVLE